eukprot:CAMPEP_0115871158 /NCGR_PEP_ID=MMETSP0287-20121206/22715_1 /TAXON_ID=412157 /ORGANISM="Chrysochromulina rotalis, Strain UIO044" /LENGTH=266 /DNA_ID=CAMNT_0003325937 /DNA_START=1 /DNA_END=798 /DNA_ORIENTATION=-
MPLCATLLSLSLSTASSLLVAPQFGQFRRESISRSSLPCLRTPAEPPAASQGLPLLLVPNAALALGGSLLVLLVGNRLFTDELLNSQSRADLIATIAPVLIVLKALSDIDITPRQPEPVLLEGCSVSWVEPSIDEVLRTELEWAAGALLAIESCAAVALYHEGRTLMLQGTLPLDPTGTRDELANAVKPGTLLCKCMERNNGAPDYLPALQLLPGRVEFGYLPAAAQGVLMLPLIGSSGALILACDRQRGFGQEEVSWARATASRV